VYDPNCSRQALAWNKQPRSATSATGANPLHGSAGHVPRLTPSTGEVVPFVAPLKVRVIAVSAEARPTDATSRSVANIWACTSGAEAHVSSVESCAYRHGARAGGGEKPFDRTAAGQSGPLRARKALTVRNWSAAVTCPNEATMRPSARVRAC